MGSGYWAGYTQLPRVEEAVPFSALGNLSSIWYAFFEYEAMSSRQLGGSFYVMTILQHCLLRSLFIVLIKINISIQSFCTYYSRIIHVPHCLNASFMP